MVPEVPRLAVTTPGRTLPVPIAPIMLSPPPAEMIGELLRPHFFLRFSRSNPTACREDPTGGSFCGSRSSIKSIIGSHHLRVRISSNPVPDASPYSMRRSPDNQKLI